MTNASKHLTQFRYLDITVTYQNYFYEQVNSTYVVNAYCRSFQGICPVGKLEDDFSCYLEYETWSDTERG